MLGKPAGLRVLLGATKVLNIIKEIILKKPFMVMKNKSYPLKH